MKSESNCCSNNKYQLLDLVGTGSRAEIYRCRLFGPEGFEKLVAQKKLQPQWSKDAAAVADFVDEAKLAALLHHENIVQATDFGQTPDGCYFLVMEYLFGKDLQAVMQRAGALPGGMPAGHALHIAAKICSGMEYAHSLKDLRQRPLNLIHRELSPENIFITFEGKVKVIDFGVARTDVFEDRTRMGMVKGDIAYMAPEQLSAAAMDHRADIFAIGILLYEMLSGKRMYGGDPTTQVMKGRKAEFPGLEAVANKLPPAICAIVDKALQPDMNRRYQSCAQMLADIEACLAAIQPRPSSHLLQRYICRLFAGELLEEKARLAGSMPPLPEERDTGQSPAVPGVHREPAPSPGRSRRLRPSVWFFAGGIGLVLMIFLLSSDIAEEDDIPVPASKPPPEAVLEPPPSLVSEPVPQQAVPVEAAPAEPQAKRPVPDLAARAKKIDDLLAKAARAWKEKRLTEPDSDCAFWFYSKILALDPKNGDAWEGIGRIGTYYGDQAEKALREHKFGEAHQYMQKGLETFPDNRRLLALQNDMEPRKRKYIAELAGKAKQALERDDLTTPAETCAYTYYKTILKLDRRNDAALDGIDRIADRYAELAEEAYRNLKLANCREFVKSGLAVAPHHPKLLELEEDLGRSMPGVFFKSLEKSFSTWFE